VADNDAFIFNLTRKRHFLCVTPSKAISTSKKHGPVFGMINELGMFSEPFNGEEKGNSTAGGSGYEIPSDV
jgi:hypothetical protein